MPLNVKQGRMGSYKAKSPSAQDEWNANVPDSWNGYAPSNYDSFSPPQQSNDIPYDSFSPPPPKTDNGVSSNQQDSYSPPPQGNDIPYDSYSPKKEAGAFVAEQDSYSPPPHPGEPSSAEVDSNKGVGVPYDSYSPPKEKRTLFQRFNNWIDDKKAADEQAFAERPADPDLFKTTTDKPNPWSEQGDADTYYSPEQRSGVRIDQLQKWIGNHGGFGSENSEQIMQLQEEMKGLGLYKGEIDGKFGAKSLKALRDFQFGRGKTSDPYDSRMEQYT